MSEYSDAYYGVNGPDDPRPAGEACVICGYPPADHEGEGRMVHDFVQLDNQCPVTSRRCDRPCGATCIRGSSARPAASGGATDGEREKWRPVCGCEQGMGHMDRECHSYGLCHAQSAERAAPVASQADGGLRAKAEQLWHDLINEDDQGAVDKLIPLLADAAKVQRVREIADEMTAQADARGGKRYRPARTLWHFADRIRRALDSDR